MIKGKGILKKNNYYENNRRLILIAVMMLCIIMAMITYWYYAYNHRKIYSSENIISYKISDYVTVDGNYLSLKNIDEKIINEFTQKQNIILSSNNVLDIDINKTLKNNILSIKITYIIESKGEEELVINVDLKENKKLSNDDMLKIIDTSYLKIATYLFNTFIKLPSSSTNVVTDSITEDKMTAIEFNNNYEKYIVRVREKLSDVINLYIEDDILKYDIKLSEVIMNLCYKEYNGSLNTYTKIELGKI